MTTRKTSCRWVRVRLPLGLGSDDADLGLDAGSRDRERIARHLDDCGACRRHRAELTEALSALSAASAISPVEPHAPSLWSGLERRIREEEIARDRRAAARPRLSSLAAFLAVGDLLPERRFGLRPGVAFGGMAAALVCGVIVLVADRQQARSRIEIAQGARPIASVSVAAVDDSPASPIDHDPEAGIDVADEGGEDRWLWDASSRTLASASAADPGDEGVRGHGSRSDLPGPLAQAEITPHSRHASGSAPAGGAGSGSVSGTATAPSSSSSSKYGFDLERGTPMAPDSRDAKPAY